jgi:hypothetical protein
MLENLWRVHVELVAVSGSCSRSIRFLGNDAVPRPLDEVSTTSTVPCHGRASECFWSKLEEGERQKQWGRRRQQ